MLILLFLLGFLWGCLITWMICRIHHNRFLKNEVIDPLKDISSIIHD